MDNIVCVADEGYAQHTAVMLLSLFETNAATSFRIFLLTFGIRATTRERLAALCSAHGSEIVFIEDDFEEIRGLPVGQWASIMYLKMLLPGRLPQDVERLLFLDVDMVINHSLSELYRIDLGEAVLAAAEDMPDCLQYKPRLGLSAEDVYINSGVMVMDLRKWRAMEKQRPMREFIRSVEGIFRNEQDLIAMYFRGKIKLLPIRWNMTTFYFMRRPRIFDRYLPQLQQARKRPCIIHFACPIKPWFKDCDHPYGGLYAKYLRQTPWREYVFPYYEQRSRLSRIKRSLRRLGNRLGIVRDDMYLMK